MTSSCACNCGMPAIMPDAQYEGCRMEPNTDHRYNSRNVVLTGLSRSGTTLACHLLNKLPDTLALNEPIDRDRFADLFTDHKGVLEGVENFFRHMRQMVLEEGEAVSRHLHGVIPANSFGPRSMGVSLRSPLLGRGRIPVGKELSPRFLLIAKDPPMFTAILPALVKRFPCYAIVRNPLAVLASWNSLDSWVREGRFSSVEFYDATLARELTTLKDRYDRQLALLHWWFLRFERCLSPENVVRYEEIVESGGAALSTIVPAAASLNEPLELKNTNPLYDRSEMLRLGKGLLASEGAYWRFYDRVDVEELLESA